MPYLIQGTIQELFEAFGYNDFLAGGTSLDVVLRDIERTMFFGTADDCQFHMDTWKDKTKSDHEFYTQGNMSAGLLYLLFGNIPFSTLTFESAGIEKYILYTKNCVKTDFAYVNKDKQLCGLNLYYLKNDPRKWMIGFIQNTNLVPSKRQVSIIINVDPEPFIKKNTALSIQPITLDDTILPALGNAPCLEPFLQQLVHADGTFNLDAEFVRFFLQMVRPADRFEDNQLLLEMFSHNIQDVMSNKALQVLRQLPIHYSPSQVLKCLDKGSALHQAVCAIPLYDEPSAIFEASWLLARNVRDQKRCIIDKLYDLKLDKKIIALLQSDDESGKIFFQAVCEVELACLDIRKGLHMESAEKRENCFYFEQDYRKAMYSMLYDQVLTPLDKTQFCDKIRAIEEPFLQALDVDTNPWLRRTLMLLVNTLTLLFTLGMLNIWHQSVSGDFLFFSRPASAEALKTLDYQMIDLISAPAA